MDVGLDFGGGGYSLQGQLDKIDYDMTKAGFPKSAIFLALRNGTFPASCMTTMIR